MVPGKVFIIVFLFFISSCISKEYIYFTQWDTGNYLHYIKLNKFKRYERIYGINDLKYIDKGKWYLKNDSIFLIPDCKFNFDSIPFLKVTETFDTNLSNRIKLRFTFSCFPNESGYYFYTLDLKKGNSDSTIRHFIFIDEYDKIFIDSTSKMIMSKLVDIENHKIDTLTYYFENFEIKKIYMHSFRFSMEDTYNIKSSKSNSFLIETNPNIPFLYDCVKNEGVYFQDSLIFEDKVGWLLQYNYTLTKKRKNKFIKEYNVMKKNNWILSIIKLDVKEYFKIKQQ